MINLLNGFYHEKFHQSDLKAIFRSATSYPFEHFDIGLSQVNHSSFKNTTENYKEFTQDVMNIYLNQQEKVLKKYQGDDKGKFYNRYKSNVNKFNLLFRAERRVLSKSDLE